MSHDRGCHCGKESSEYRQCLVYNPNCSKRSVVQMWNDHKAAKLLPKKETNMPGDINKITVEDIEKFSRTLYCTHSYDNNSLDEYQRIATKTAIYPGVGSPIGLMYVALKGAGEAGEFAEHVGKAMRDDFFGPAHGDKGTTVLTPNRREALIKEIGDQLWYLSAKCNELGISLSHAALVNLQKLQSRSERGKLQGSGDNR